MAAQVQEVMTNLQKLQRLQMEKESFIVTIKTHDAVFSNNRYKDFECYKNGFNLCFSRGKKFSCTKNKPITVDPLNKMRVLEFNESLSLVVTLYKNKKGAYQEKVGKLILRTFNSELKKYEQLGHFDLKLHSLIAATISCNPDAAFWSKNFVFPIIGDGELALDCELSCQLINLSDIDTVKKVEFITANSSKSYHLTADPSELEKNNRVANSYDKLELMYGGSSPTMSRSNSPNSSKNNSPLKYSSSSKEYLESTTAYTAELESSKSTRLQRLSISNHYKKELSYPSLASSPSKKISDNEVATEPIGISAPLDEVIVESVVVEENVVPVVVEETVAPVVLEETVAPVVLEETVAPVVLEETVAPVVVEETVAPVVVEETVAPVVLEETVAPVMLEETVALVVVEETVAPVVVEETVVPIIVEEDVATVAEQINCSEKSIAELFDPFTSELNISESVPSEM